MTDVYTVATRMILEDQGMITGLERLVQMLREVNELLEKSRGQLRGLFNSALTDRATRFAEGLQKANTEARELNKSLESLAHRRLNFDGAGGSGNGGGNGNGHGDGHGGGWRGAWHGTMRAVNTYYDAQMVGDIVGSVFERGVEMSHQAYAAGQQGISGPDVQRMRTAAFAMARQVPSQSVNDIFKAERELYPLAMMGLKPGESPVDRLLSHLKDAINTDELIGRFMGGEKGSHVSEYWNLLRAGESLGFQGDKLSEFVGEGVRSIVASGGRINAEQLRQVVQKGGATAIALDPNALLKQFPELILEQGGSAVGTMLATFARSAAGRMTLQSAEEQLKLGLIRPGMLSVNHGHPVVAEGGFVGEQERYANPTAYAIDYLAPALLKHMGINTAGMTHDEIAERISAQGLSQDEKVKLITELNRLFSDRNAAKGAEQFLLQAQQIERFMKLYDQTKPGTIDAARAGDATEAIKSVKGAWDTLLTALTDDKVRKAMPGANFLADAMTWTAQQLSNHPRIAGPLELGMGAGGIGMAGVIGYKFLAAGPALTGAAGQLSAAATALDAAAAKLGGGNVPGGGKPPPGGAAASWLGYAGTIGTGLWAAWQMHGMDADLNKKAEDLAKQGKLKQDWLDRALGWGPGGFWGPGSGSFSDWAHQGVHPDAGGWHPAVNTARWAAKWHGATPWGGGGDGGADKVTSAVTTSGAAGAQATHSAADRIVSAIMALAPSLGAAISGGISKAMSHEAGKAPTDAGGVDGRTSPQYPATAY